MEVFNLHGDDWDRTSDREGWRSKDAFVGKKLGGELLGASLYEVAPGNRLWPYHTHHANEEWLVVVSGSPVLRTPSGERQLREGDVACFRRGTDGAHQVSNPTDSPARVLMVSTLLSPEIVEYPDTGKVATRDARGKRLWLGRPGPELDYWEGED